MAILGVHKQWALVFSEPLKDLKPIDLISFKMISEAGNIMPSCEIDFFLRDKSKFHELEQGKPITVAVGTDENSLMSGNFAIFKRLKVREEPDYVLVRLILTHQSINYSVNTSVAIYNEKSKNLIATMAGEGGLSFTSNIDDTMDKMKWVRHNISPRRMVNKLWTHSILPNSRDIMLIGITPEGKLHCRSLEKTKAGIGVGKWAFIPYIDCPTNNFTPVYYTQSLEYKSHTGTIDYLGGYSQSRIVHNTDDKSTSMISAKSSPTLAQTKKDESINVAKRFSNVSLQSKDNMHGSWYNRENYTVRSLIKLNAHTIKIICEGQYAPVEVTDIAFVYDRTTDTSGLWLVKKVCHRVYNNVYTLIVTVCRDNPNEVKG